MPHVKTAPRRSTAALALVRPGSYVAMETMSVAWRVPLFGSANPRVLPHAVQLPDRSSARVDLPEAATLVKPSRAAYAQYLGGAKV